MVSIAKLSKVRKDLKKFEREYKLSLKPRETEEVINQMLNRPLAFITAKFFHRLRKSPNFVTLFSLSFGVASGLLFAKGEYYYVLAAAILLELMIIFDCADGQLARMSGMSSPFGKTLDPALGGDPDYQDAMPGVYHVKNILAIEASIGYKW